MNTDKNLYMTKSGDRKERKMSVAGPPPPPLFIPPEPKLCFYVGMKRISNWLEIRSPDIRPLCMIPDILSVGL